MYRANMGNPGGSLEQLALPSRDRASARGGMPEEVASILREAILSGLLAPNSWLREAEVARQLKVSRTPVRDAFRILEAEGLVIIKANQGAMVSAMTTDDVIELSVVRTNLEELAARLAARRAHQQCAEEFAELIPKIKKAGEQHDLAELSQLNFQFHVIVRNAAGNRHLARMLAQLQSATRRFTNPTLGLPGRVEESVREHVELADAITRGDPDDAARLASEHQNRLSELRIRMLLNM
ncbi:MAG: GntR family transcriptional regulator [Nocardiopsaceae bacterium]|jgi:DNA-binding GntR family transcriptional regulator|nr:GntR family transcriptional regulator [Nocardiopsaceae bacterium]